MKRLIAPFIILFVIGSVFLIVDAKDKNDLKKEKEIEKVLKPKTLKEKYQGTWVDTNLNQGKNIITFTFTKKDTAKMTYEYNDIVHGKSALFETTVTFDKDDEASFAFYDDNWDHEGRGDVFLEENQVSLYINSQDKTDKEEDFGVREKMTVFKKKNEKVVESAFQHVSKKEIDMFRRGFLPKENIQYSYKTVDGESSKVEKIYKLDDDIMLSSQLGKQGKYEENGDGLFFTNEKGKKEQLLKFPIKKGQKWIASKGVVKEIIDDKYTLYGLEDIVVVKDYKTNTYTYYHEDLGKVGEGITLKGKHKPVWILQNIKTN